MKTCSECQKDMRFNPKGVGKTKESFWGCSDYPNCKNTATPTEEEVKKYELQARREALDSDFTKFKSIARFNATNSAIEMVNGKPSKAEWNAEFYQQQIIFWTDWFYEGHLEWFVKNVINEED